MTMEVNQLVFGWVDYTLFGGLLGLSLLIGIYFGFFSKQDSTSEYLFGGKTMHYIPVATSILASFLSGITYLGIPTEVYFHGSQFLVAALVSLAIGPISAYMIMPVFYNLQVSSCYDYLEMRFSNNVRIFTSIIFIISLFLYIPIVIYVPALAFSQVTGYNLHTITPVLSIICIIYTSLGGVKAVVWTDAIQFIFTIVGLIAVLVLGTMSVNGVSEVWRLANEGGRIRFFDIDPSPFKRDSFWLLSVGSIFSFLTRLAVNQKYVQRYLAIEKESEMKKAVFLTTIGMAIIQAACVFTGLLIYAHYRGCDLLKTKIVARNDQILPHYVMDVAGHLSGLPGIFLAGLVSSALSTMSASLNTLSGLMYSTFIDKLISEGPKKEAMAANIMKVLSVIIGAITIGMIFIIERLGSVFEMSVILLSSTEGAILGLFAAGLFIPWIGKKGAIFGASVGLSLMVCFVGMTQWYILNGKLRHGNLPMSMDSCPYPFNKTTTTEIVNPSEMLATHEPPLIFQISIYIYSLMGGIMTITVALITSYFTSEMDISKVNPDHFSPIIRNLLPRNKMYIGIPIKMIKENSDVRIKT